MTEITNFTSPNQVLAFIGNRISFGAIISDKNVEGINGKKVIPAGTPVGGTTNFLQDESAILDVTNDKNAQGVLEHEVDVTDGTGNATVVVEGYINENRLPKELSIADTAKTALKNITFVRR